ncbi:hypothetical protein AB0K52_12540 [Glycomyces sp. NPDC049804]|uniref:hypothetical protein n=1 Tax=Glycomyces sp. NPDC049804 TaxID=3154363 RepID=UPI0034348BDC
MDDEPLSRSERAELERLRAEVAARKPHARSGRRGARWLGAVVVLVLAALIGMLSIVVVYARDQLLDTDRYVATVAPLAEDDDVRAAVSARVADTVNEKLDIESYVDQAMDAIQTRGAPERLDALAAPIASALEGFVADQVHAVVYSDRFAQLWTSANTTAHEAVAAILRGETSETLQVQGDTLYIDLGPLVEQVKSALVDRGLTIAERIPAVSVQFALIEVRGLANAQGAAELLDVLAWAMPLTAIALLLAGVYIAPNRRRALLIGAVLLAAAMLVLLIAVAVARTITLANLPEEVRSPEAVASVYDIVVRFLTAGAQTAIVVALIVALAAWLAGPGVGAAAIRRAASGLLDLAATGLARSGLPLGPVPAFLVRNRRALEWAAVALALVWLILWPHRGVSGALWVTLTLAAVVAVIEVLARTEQRKQMPLTAAHP